MTEKPAPAVETSLEAAALQTGGLMRRATYAAVAVAFTLVAVKLIAWLVTDSVALLSSLIDSMLDGMASVVNLMAVRHALQPADAEHRFGHGKAEPLAGLAQSAFVAGSAVLLIVQAGQRLLNPVPVKASGVGIAVMIFSIVLTLLLVAYQRRVVRKTKSVAISADSLHYTGDVLINGSVIVSLILSSYLGMIWADPLFGAAIALYLLVNAFRIARGSLDFLMDRELDEADRQKILEIARSHPRVHDVHDLRTRSSGLHTFIQFHLEMDRDLSLVKAHAIADQVELRVRRAFPNAEVLIHQDPADIREPRHDEIVYEDREQGIPPEAPPSKGS